MTDQKITFVMSAQIPQDGVEQFRDYESKVIPLLSKHGGMLERRLTNGEGTVEIHIISFQNKISFEAFCHDPERLEFTEIFDKSGAQTELRQMQDFD